MAIYKSEKYVWNATTNTWDLYYNKTSADNIVETTGAKVLTSAERDKISDYLTSFNEASKLLMIDANGDIRVPGNISGTNISGKIYTDDISSDSGFINIGNGVDEVKIDAEKVVLNGTGDGIFLEGATVVNGTADFNNNAVFKDVFINGTIDSDTGSVEFDVESVVFNDAELKSISDPVDAQDAANKRWVEQLVAQGTHVIGAVRAATTGNVASLSGTVTIDGVALAEEDRVLVRAQTTSSQNGVYIVNSGTWTKLPKDSDKGSLVTVLEGTTQKRRQYYNQNGTTWVLFWIDDDYYAATNGGLELDATGLGFAIKAEGVTNAMLAGSINQGKLEHFNSLDDDPWNLMPAASASTSLSSRIDGILSSIRALRGTGYYNSANTQTIADAYSKIELKNSIKYGTTVPTGNTNGADGDVFLKRLN